MDELQKVLDQIEDIPEELDDTELEKWLKNQDLLLGKMQQSLDKSDERYMQLHEKRENVEKARQILRKRTNNQKNSIGQNQDGLVPKGSGVQNADNQSDLPKKERLNRFYDAEGAKDITKMLQAYKEISIAAENQDLDAFYEMLLIDDEFHFYPGPVITAMEKGSKSALSLCARIFCRQAGNELDMETKLQILERYIEQSEPMNGHDSREYSTEYEILKNYCFYIDKLEKYVGKVSELEKKLKKYLPEPTNEDAEKRGRLYYYLGNFYTRDGEYDEAIKHYMKYNQFEISDGHRSNGLCKIYFLLDDPMRKQKLDAYFNDIMNNNSIERFDRSRIFAWYAMRYETGKEMKKDRVQAFLYYWKSEQLWGSGAGKEKRVELLMKAVESNDLSAENFLLSIGEAGYWDAYKYLGDKYAKYCGISNYEKAQEFYLKGQNGNMKSECEKLCSQMADRVEQAIVYQKAVELLSSDRYEYAFKELKKLAEADFPEACLKVAEISENKDSYQSLKLSNYLLEDKDIRNNYRKAAQAGIVEAQKKMVAIYRDGLLGAQPDREARQKWENRLSKGQ